MWDESNTWTKVDDDDDWRLINVVDYLPTVDGQTHILRRAAHASQIIDAVEK